MVETGAADAASRPPDAESSPRPPGRRRPWLALIAIAIVAAVLLSVSGSLRGGSSTVPSPPATGGPSSASPGASGVVASGSVAPSPTDGASRPPVASPGDEDYLLMPREELMALPTSGAAWEALLAVADGPQGRPDLTDQNERHGVIALASALIYARTGEPAYREQARVAVMAAIGTERPGADNSILSLGRQLGAYVLAADLIRLDGDDDVTFRRWLSSLRTRELGGHGRWRTLRGTHEDSANNWGAFAGASRIAASLYLGDAEDVERAADVLRGFLGDASAWDDFQPVEGSRSWACDPSSYTPVNPPCERDGIDLDGAIVRDISRSGRLRWPPGEAGIRYTLESLQGLVLQAELLYRAGRGDPWGWSDSALRRAARIVTASGADGGRSWEHSEPSRYVPWLLNARYEGVDVPTEPAGFGRVFGYTDWLYGS